ncbi:MAG: exosortase A [Acetobacteraceae bacterium]
MNRWVVSGRIGAIRGERTARFLSGLRDAWLGLAIGLIALGIVFHVEIAAAVKTWITSTAYNHCFLVIPIALYLIWDRRASLRGLIAAPMPVVALLALPIGIVWLAAERLGIMEGRQLAAVSMVEVLFLAMLGRRLWTSVSGPLLYLYLLVPFGEFLTSGLQDITTWFIRHGLNIMGIPAYIDGYVIDIPEGTFFVAEACAGLRFLIASIAFGVLYALLMYRDPMRRALFIVVSVIVPIVATGLAVPPGRSARGGEFFADEARDAPGTPRPDHGVRGGGVGGSCSGDRIGARPRGNRAGVSADAARSVAVLCHHRGRRFFRSNDHSARDVWRHGDDHRDRSVFAPIDGRCFQRGTPASDPAPGG